MWWETRKGRPSPRSGLWSVGPGAAGGRAVSPQVWQCGGSMEVLPCSRVAHIERSKKPYNNDIDYYAKRNALRAAEVWMDSFKSHVYMAWNIPMTVSWGAAGRGGRRLRASLAAPRGDASKDPGPTCRLTSTGSRRTRALAARAAPARRPPRCTLRAVCLCFLVASYTRYRVCIAAFCLCLFLRERQIVSGGGSERGREETQNPKQALGSKRSAQSPTQGSNPRTVRS